MGKVHPRVPLESRGAVSRSKAKPSFRLRSRTKKAVFVVLVIVIFAVAAGMIFQSSEKGVPIDSSATPIRVSMSGFSPNTLTVKAGTPLRLDLINLDNQYHTDGGGWHNFVIEAFGMNRSVEPLGQALFSVPTDSAGTYTWYCDVCCGGKDNPSMRGTLVVEP